MKNNRVFGVISVLILITVCGILSMVSVKKADAEEVNVTIDSVYMYDSSSEIVQGDYGKVVITDKCVTDMVTENIPLVWEYKSANPEVLQIDNQGNYTALSQGIADIEVKIYRDMTDAVQYESGTDGQGDLFSEGRTYCYSFFVSADASAAVPDNTNITCYSTGKSVTVHLSNLPVLQYYRFDYECLKEGMYVNCTFDSVTNNISFSSYYACEGTVQIKLNNATINIYVIVKEVGINYDNLLLTVKSNKTLKIRNYSKSKVTWNSIDPAIVKVDANGVITTKKLGNTVVYATLDNGEQFGCAICVVTSQMKKVVDRAKMIGSKWTYSQPLRMKKGYYDCSSLVWQCYKLAGKTFGSSYYAPVAADILRWCVKNKKNLKKSVQKNIYNFSLRPGDITFRTGANNGRYKGVYHVEMFVGYRCAYMSEGKYTLNTMWAARTDNYPPDDNYIARP